LTDRAALIFADSRKNAAFKGYLPAERPARCLKRTARLRWPTVQNQFYLLTVGIDKYPHLFPFRPIPMGLRRLSSPPFSRLDGQINHRLLAPPALPLPGGGFLITAQIEESPRPAAGRPAGRLSQIIKTDPKKLAGRV